jgi:RNA polymerase sigma-70 factor (ECF subfamily)
MQASEAALLAGQRDTEGDRVGDRGRLEPASAIRVERLATLAADHYDFIWRSLRRLGLAPPAVDDAAQQVFVLCALKLDRIDAGRERAFLFQSALRVAMSVRRDFAQRREAMAGDAMDEISDPGPLPDAAAEMRQRRLILDRVLDALPLDLRTVFILYEIEGLGSPEIASMLSVPVGTVASRLRRAREAFQAEAGRVRKQLERKVPR